MRTGVARSGVGSAVPPRRRGARCGPRPIDPPPTSWFARLTRLICFFAFLIAAPALAEKRVALVIGNSAYKYAPVLPNPKNDAEAMAAALKTLNFDVALGVDLDKPGMERLLQGFAEKLEKADVALVFYAGHGLMVNGANYLVPIDGKLERESDLLFQAIPADTIQRLMEQAQRTNIIILDACRDNPLARSLARSMGTRSTAIGRGLAPMTAGIGTLIVYATAPGHQALDGEGKNSPFTAALLKHIATPKLEIRDVFTRVRQEVFEATKTRPQPQIPWDTSSLMASVYLAGATDAPAPATPPGVTPPAPPASPPSSADNDALFWQSIKDSKNAADYKAYLSKYPQGTFAELAKIRIAEIEKAAVVTPPAPTPEKPAPQSTRPTTPKRTSTRVPGTTLSLGATIIWPVLNITSTEQCGAACLANQRCVAWDHLIDASYTSATSPERCRLYSTVGKPQKNSLYVAGVIRTTPAAAPAQPGLQPGAPQPSGPLTAVIRRKAAAGDKENGFCASVPWPNLTGPSMLSEDYSRVLHTERAYKHLNYCAFERIIERGQTTNGLKCVVTEIAMCYFGLGCFHTWNRYAYQIGPPGRWVSIFDQSRGPNRCP